tara:strand:- start:563 stop:826 length:264 start_codon:yes stop_codon:yes gene_type:complete
MVQQNINMRDYSITKKSGQLHNCEVVDSYGNEYQNYFDTEQECINWVYYIWEKEEWFNSVDSQELLGKAIQQCKEMDSKNPNLRDIL